MSDAPQDKKIIVDEDWKTQVEAEREKLRKEETPGGGGQAPPTGAPGLPPPDLLYIAEMLSLQVLVALGLMPDPIAKEAKVRLPVARHAIDTLQVLYDKTQGNRTEEETQVMDQTLHQLRMAFVEVQRQPLTAAAAAEKPAQT